MSDSCRQNQELEQGTFEAEEEKLRLQMTADRLTERLDAIMKDRFSFKSSAFDADTPIDKTLNFLSDYIGVRTDSMHTCLAAFCCIALPQPL